MGNKNNRKRSPRPLWTEEELEWLRQALTRKMALADPRLAHRGAISVERQWDRVQSAARARRAKWDADRSAPNPDYVDAPPELPDTPTAPPPPPPPEFGADRQRANDAHWQGRYESLYRQYEKALKELSAVDRLVAQATDLAPLSYQPAPPVKPLRRHSGKNQSAVLQLSDSHVGLVVSPDQTLGFGGYNWKIFLARLAYLEDSIGSILTQHVATGIDRIVVAMLGDMIHGALNHAAEAAQVNTLFAQFYGAGHAFAQFLRRVATFAPEIEVKTVVGNHPRWQNQHKMPTVNRNSNLDQFLYALIQSLVRDIPNIRFDLDMQPLAEFSLYQWQFLAAHGDHWKGGDRALGIPAHAIGRELSAKSQLYAKAGRPPINYYLTGHLHREISLPHANGSVMVNGGFPGVDCYGMMENFAPIDPSQRFFLVHPTYGVTAQYSLTLKHASEAEGDRYVMPFGTEIALV